MAYQENSYAHPHLRIDRPHQRMAGLGRRIGAFA